LKNITEFSLNLNGNQVSTFSIKGLQSLEQLQRLRFILTDNRINGLNDFCRILPNFKNLIWLGLWLDNNNIYLLNKVSDFDLLLLADVLNYLVKLQILLIDIKYNQQFKTSTLHSLAEKLVQHKTLKEVTLDFGENGFTEEIKKILRLRFDRKTKFLNRIKSF
jgi:hypothetical protein